MGWEAKVTPPVELPGEDAKTSFDPPTWNKADVALVTPGAVAEIWSPLPVAVILQPENVATPLMAATVMGTQTSDPLPLLRASVT